MHSSHKAFTLIELLVVLAIISLLSSVVLASLSGARKDARRTAAQAELNSVHTAIQMLINDTGAGPGGCEDGGAEGNRAGRLDTAEAGLTQLPTVGSTENNCTWSQAEVDGWSGPYVSSDELMDPWGGPYRFDSGWYLYDNGNCPSYRSTIDGAIFSYAGTPGTSGDNMCDDIWVDIGQ